MYSVGTSETSETSEYTADYILGMYHDANSLNAETNTSLDIVVKKRRKTIICRKCEYVYYTDVHSEPYCSITCAIMNDDIDITAKMLTTTDSRQHLLSCCKSVEMIRLIRHGANDVELINSLQHALKESINLYNARVLIDEIYTIKLDTDLSKFVAKVSKAEIANHIIKNCPNFNPNVGLSFIIDAFEGPGSNYNLIFRITMYLLYANADSSILPENFVNDALSMGYGQILTFIKDKSLYSNTAAPYLNRYYAILNQLINTPINIPGDVGNLVMSYVGYDLPLKYRFPTIQDGVRTFM